MSLSELKVRKLVRRVEKLDREAGIDHGREDQIRARCEALNTAEASFLWKAVSRGKNTRVLRHGWPDFLIVEDGKAYAVEVKAGKDRISARQAEMFQALEAIGVKVFVWNPKAPDKLIAWTKWPRSSRS